MAKKKPASDEAPAEAKVAKGLTRIYPTHRRGPGPLVVAIPADPTHSEELTITDKGADVPDALAAQLIAAREATTDDPAE
jgi:hypothetical protein